MPINQVKILKDYVIIELEHGRVTVDGGKGAEFLVAYTGTGPGTPSAIIPTPCKPSKKK